MAWPTSSPPCHQSCPTRCLTPGDGMGDCLCQPTEKKKPLSLSVSLSASVGERQKEEEENKVADSSHSFLFSCTTASRETSVPLLWHVARYLIAPLTFYLHSKVALYLPFIKGVQMWPPCNLMPGGVFFGGFFAFLFSSQVESTKKKRTYCRALRLDAILKPVNEKEKNIKLN